MFKFTLSNLQHEILEHSGYSPDIYLSDILVVSDDAAFLCCTLLEVKKWLTASSSV